MFFENLWKEISTLNEVQSIALAGSRASEKYDEKSDYDLYIYCDTVPSDEVRKSILEKYCDYIELGNHFWELEDNCTLKNGIDIDILYRNIDTITEELSSVVEKYNAHNGYTTCIWHNVLHSKILYDKNDKFKKMQDRFSVPYPEELKNNIIEKNMNLLSGILPSYDKQITKALNRNDLPSINHRTSAFVESYFDIIFALNKMTHPGEKRMIEYAKGYGKILPKNFEENLTSLFSNMFSDKENTLLILENIVTEIKKVI